MNMADAASHHLIGLQAVCLEHHAKRPVSYHTFRRVVDHPLLSPCTRASLYDMATGVGVPLYYTALKDLRVHALHWISLQPDTVMQEFGKAYQLLSILILINLVIFEAQLLELAVQTLQQFEQAISQVNSRGTINKRQTRRKTKSRI